MPLDPNVQALLARLNAQKSPLHTLTMKVSPQSAALLKMEVANYGPLVFGRRTFDIVDGWSGNPPQRPCFVVTHAVPAKWDKPGSPFIFVTDGVASAIHQAQQVAGDKNVVILGAAIELERLKVVEAPGVTHLRFRVVK